MSLPVHRVDAFTRDGRGGNPAGVVLAAHGLSNATMQSVAAELGYSETVFLVAREEGSVTVQFFAPKQEVAVCGHATIALFHALHQLEGLVGDFTMRCGAGDLNVSSGTEGDVYLTQTKPVVGERLSIPELSASLGIEQSLFAAEPSAHRIASTGLKKIFTEVVDRQTLNTAAPHPKLVEDVSRRHGAIGIYLYARASKSDACDVFTRNYAPVVGIWDDAATGTSVAALTGVLEAREDWDTSDRSWVIYQGDPIGCPSRIEAHYRSGDLQIGGHAHIVESFNLEV